MLETKIISSQELSKFGQVENLDKQALALVEQQKSTWGLAGKNFEALTRIQTRDFDFGRFKITAQFNSERIRSSAAKTDAKSIAKRPCFLCLNNLPQEQKGLLFQNNYLILTNPFPIFPKHLTILNLKHIPQQIYPHFADLLGLSRNLPGFTIFYNGPQCGASAPDHFHFQAGNTGYLPVENEFKALAKNHAEIVFQTRNSKIIAVENYLRRMVAIVSAEKKFIAEKFETIYHLLQSGTNEEPMMNILCNFSGGKWRVIIFPREKQRPSHFFRDDEKRLTVSPAAVEMGGILVLPHKNDFTKITKQDIAEIYKEVTIGNENFKDLLIQIKKLSGQKFTP